MSNRSKQDRVTIDASGLRDRVNAARRDPLWAELSLSKQLRILVIERLEQLENVDSSEPKRESEGSDDR